MRRYPPSRTRATYDHRYGCSLAAENTRTLRLMEHVTLESSSTALTDVFEEYLDEASYYLKVFTRRLDSPTTRLDELASYPEPALFAQLDGLVDAARSDQGILAEALVD